jgi:dihydroorotate dehydrogenase (fumarate)
MADLSTKYMGLKLETPLVVASSALSNRLEHLRTAQASGAGAVVLRSLFEEQIEATDTALQEELERVGGPGAEGASFFPSARVGPEEYLKLVAQAKDALRIPVIASLNCSDTGSWPEYAGQIEKAGADALEVNIYTVNADPGVTGEQIERQHVEILQSVRKTVRIPIALKLSPFYTSVANTASRFEGAGANGLVIFNRFLQPDIDLGSMGLKNEMHYSSQAEMLLSLRWIALLHGRVKVDLAASTGVYGADDVVKQLLAGATVVQLASALLKHGLPHLAVLRDGLSEWMEEKGHEKIEDFRGTLSQKSVPEPGAFERAQYVHLILSQSA